MQTNLVRVGDIGASLQPRFTHGYECPCDACRNYEPVRGVPVNLQFVQPDEAYAPKPPDVPFPQTIEYEPRRHVLAGCTCDDCERDRAGISPRAWLWLLCAGWASWALILAAVGWLVGLVVG